LEATVNRGLNNSKGRLRIMTEKKKTGFGLMLRELRRYQNLSQEELASRVGLNPSYISYLERGKKIHPSTEILAALSREFELKGVSRQKFYNEAHRITPLDLHFPYQTGDIGRH